MQDIDELFRQDVDRVFYHYTSVSSLMGMAQSKCLWASNINYMNDAKEMVQACEILERVIHCKMDNENFSDEESKFLFQFISWVNACKHTTYNIFVFSLTEEPSLLSQWRSYTPHGKGVSIGFNAQVLNNIIKKYDLKIAQCFYQREEQEYVLSNLVEKLLFTFREDLPKINISNSHPSQCYNSYLETFRGKVLQVLSIIKHEAFREEREWRLVSPYYANYTIPLIKFREGASMLVPYIELELGENKPYFENVILGPSPHQNLSMSALSMFLSNQGLCNTTVNCNLPYREW